MRLFAILFFLFAALITIAQRKNSTPQFTLHQADSLFQIKDWKGAIPAYETVLKTKPENSVGWNRLGFSYHNLSLYDKALASYLKSLEYKPAPQVEVVVQSRLARVYSVKRENDKALQSLDKALALGYNNLSELDTQKEFKSINFVDPATGKWKQIWVGSNGINVTEFLNGEYRDGAMRFDFETTNSQGGKQLVHFHFYNQGPDQVRQFHETSNDAGKTWVTTYDFTYKRKK